MIDLSIEESEFDLAKTRAIVEEDVSAAGPTCAEQLEYAKHRLATIIFKLLEARADLFNEKAQKEL